MRANYKRDGFKDAKRVWTAPKVWEIEPTEDIIELFRDQIASRQSSAR